MLFENTNIGIATFNEESTEIMYWHCSTIIGSILPGASFMAQAQNLSRHAGTMKPLPKWVQQGSIIGIVNGQDYVDEKYKKMKDLGLPMVGIWM